ncbi:MAG: macrolide ABC transporter ATP-binding protein [Candidatus Cloacimonadota bacterium]|nr:MAG: macrolide ABC transporter ATP-binding protein [Candidatus Cloacimonadota bacterium]
MQSAIKTSQLRKIYNMGKVSVEALKGVTVEIKKGEFTAITGPSGSGKSTLMHILGCLDSPTSGSYILDGEEVSGMSKSKLAKVRNFKIGFIFQTFNLLPHINIQKNVELPLMYAGVSSSERAKKAAAVLESVGLGNRLKHKPSELSGGQRQRVAIARAVINNPAIILADEPTGNLDTGSGKNILRIFTELHEKGHTIVMVTHDREVAKYADREIRIVDGETVNGNLV